MENPIPTIGRIVHYRLSKEDIEQIGVQRSKVSGGGQSINFGNPVYEGDIFPMLITRTWGDTPESCVNGQVFLDGSDSLWVTSVNVGEGPRTFSWPQRA